MNHETIQKSNAYKNDTRCCTVVTLSVIAGIKFDEAQAVMADAGRKLHKGCRENIYRSVYEKFCKLNDSHLASYEGKTVSHFMKSERKFLKNNTVAIRTNGHIFAVKSGKIQDWMSANRRHRIKNIYLIEKKLEDVDYKDALVRGRKIVEKSLAALEKKKSGFTYRTYNRSQRFMHTLKYTFKMISKDGRRKIRYVRYASDESWLGEFYVEYSKHYEIDAHVESNREYIGEYVG